MTESFFAVQKKNKAEKEHEEDDEQVFDWWTKYFASLECFREKQLELPAMLRKAHVDKPAIVEIDPNAKDAAKSNKGS